MVMPSARHTLANRLDQQFPGRLGLLIGPGDWRPLRHDLPFALDNDRFAAVFRGKPWTAVDYVAFLNKVKVAGVKPRWAVVPDVPKDAKATLEWWDKWAPEVRRRLRCPLAMAVQDGMTPNDVWCCRPPPEVIFVGGTTEWKWQSLSTWTKYFPRVHVGRVNSYARLWAVHESGAESSDGTRWWHDDQGDTRHYAALVRYLDRSGRGLPRNNLPDLFGERRAPRQ